jgi:endo-1,4-beta-xylanase
MKKVLGFLAVMLLFASCQKEALDKGVKANQLKTYQSGTNNGYFWSLWKSDGMSGYVTYTNGSGGNYSVAWNMNGNFTCGKGWSSGSKTRKLGYNCGAFTLNGGGGSMAYYGWCRNPLMEYYVNEIWGASRPTNGGSLRTISSDGGSYNVYTAWRSNAPSIDGTKSFRQIYSTRTSKNSTGQNHAITFANHANAWSASGYGLGSDMSPAAILLTEAWGQSNGYCNVTVWAQ